MWSARYCFSKEQAFSRWANKAKEIANVKNAGTVQKSVALISSTKNKIAETEQENEDLAAENEELRQFSLDGYEIAKSV